MRVPWLWHATQYCAVRALARSLVSASTEPGWKTNAPRAAKTDLARDRGNESILPRTTSAFEIIFSFGSSAKSVGKAVLR